jgi:hypothetical protein
MRMPFEREQELIRENVEKEVAHALDLLSRERTYENVQAAANTLTRAAWRLEPQEQRV